MRQKSQSRLRQWVKPTPPNSRRETVSEELTRYKLTSDYHSGFQETEPHPEGDLVRSDGKKQIRGQVGGRTPEV